MAVRLAILEHLGALREELGDHKDGHQRQDNAESVHHLAWPGGILCGEGIFVLLN